MPDELSAPEEKQRRGPRSNQKLKILYLAKILLEYTDAKNDITLQDIIDKLAAYNVTAERKSLYDDIAQLNDFGIKIKKTQYGRTSHYQVINRDFENMTGIHNRNIKNAPGIKEALEHLIDWIGEREYQVYAWSESDRNQILHEIKAKNIESKKLETFMEEECWIDYQAVFKKRFQLSRLYSLEEALCNSDIEPEGKFHDGLDDAINTGYLIEKLEKYPDFQLLSYAMPETEEHLSCTIGDLFANLQLQVG